MNSQPWLAAQTLVRYGFPHDVGHEKNRNMLIKVTKPYTAQYPDPISFDAGATVHVERDDPEYPGWFWCRVSSGKAGWVHRSFLERCSGTTTGLRAYSARELTVVGGENGTAIHQLDGWVYVRLDTRIEGWLPQDNVRISAS